MDQYVEAKQKQIKTALQEFPQAQRFPQSGVRQELSANLQRELVHEGRLYYVDIYSLDIVGEGDKFQLVFSDLSTRFILQANLGAVQAALDRGERYDHYVAIFAISSVGRLPLTLVGTPVDDDFPHIELNLEAGTNVIVRGDLVALRALSPESSSAE